jgi:ABC-type transporter Mla subunit MlaD
MRYTIQVITFLLVAALAMGCTSKDKNAPVEPKKSETAAVQLDKVQTETKEAAQAMKDYTYAQKAEFLAEMETKLDEIREELDRLSAKVDKSTGAAKDYAKTQLDAVHKEWTKAKNQLDEAKDATESTWDNVKDGFNRSYDALKDSFEKTRQWLSEKIEP